MPTRTELLGIWREFCENNVPQGTIVTYAEELANKGALRPDGTYLTLKITSGPVSNGKAELRPEGDQFYICEQERWTISIQAFRADADQILNTLKTRLQDPVELETLKESSADIAIVERGSVNNITALLDTGFERRFGMDVIFLSATKLATDLDSIEDVGLSGVFRDAKNGDRPVPEFTVSKP